MSHCNTLSAPSILGTKLAYIIITLFMKTLSDLHFWGYGDRKKSGALIQNYDPLSKQCLDNYENKFK